MKSSRFEGKRNTLANGISLLGITLVALGIKKGVDTRTGAALVIAGRACDLIDGPVARAMKEDTPLGAVIDASFDKLGCLAILWAMDKKNMIPRERSAALVTQNLANGYAAAKAEAAHPDQEFLPTYTGKTAMFTQNIGFMSYMFNGIVRRETEALQAAAEGQVAVDPELQAQIEFRNKLVDVSTKLGQTATLEGAIILGIPATQQYYERI